MQRSRRKPRPDGSGCLSASPRSCSREASGGTPANPRWLNRIRNAGLRSGGGSHRPSPASIHNGATANCSAVVNRHDFRQPLSCRMRGPCVSLGVGIDEQADDGAAVGDIHPDRSGGAAEFQCGRQPRPGQERLVGEAAGSGWTPWRASSTRSLRPPQEGAPRAQRRHGLLDGRSGPRRTAVRPPASDPASPPALQPRSTAATCRRSLRRSQRGGTTPAGLRRAVTPAPRTPPGAPSSTVPRTAPTHRLMALQCVHHVSERVFMMSPVCTGRGLGRGSFAHPTLGYATVSPRGDAANARFSAPGTPKNAKAKQGAIPLSVEYSATNSIAAAATEVGLSHEASRLTRFRRLEYAAIGYPRESSCPVSNAAD